VRIRPQSHLQEMGKFRKSRRNLLGRLGWEGVAASRPSQDCWFVLELVMMRWRLAEDRQAVRPLVGRCFLQSGSRR
jgi:hypothetical protein